MGSSDGEDSEYSPPPPARINRNSPVLYDCRVQLALITPSSFTLSGAGSPPTRGSTPEVLGRRVAQPTTSKVTISITCFNNYCYVHCHTIHCRNV